MEELLATPQDSSLPARRRPASLPRRTAGNPPGVGLSTPVTQAVKTVNAIFHLINKDWGKKTSHTIGNSRKQWTVYRVDDSHYIPASQHDFCTLLHILELTHAAGLKDFSFTQVIIPEYRSESTPAIRVTNVMVVSQAHGALDGFTLDIWRQITNEVDRDKEKWSFRNKFGVMIHLTPFIDGPAGMSLRPVQRVKDSNKEPDQCIAINWKEKGVRQWPFWVHESSVSQPFTDVEKKALAYVEGSKSHVSIISILNMEDRNGSPGQPKDWRVDLSIWRIKREDGGDGKYFLVSDKLMDRIEVYPNILDPPPTVTITQQDLVTIRRSENEGLLDVKMEIDLAKVHQIAERAVDIKETAELNLPSSLPSSDQIEPGSPRGSIADGSNASYQSEEGSEKAASQYEDTSLRRHRELHDDPLSPINNNSQDDLEKESGVEEASIGDDSEGDDKGDSSGTSEPIIKH